jgi:hypothetical protein
VIEGKSVLEQLEAEAPEQAKVRATEAIRRTGAADPEGVREYLSGFEEAKGLATNQESFMAEIKRIRSDVNLTDAERLQAPSCSGSHHIPQLRIVQHLEDIPDFVTIPQEV